MAKTPKSNPLTMLSVEGAMSALRSHVEGRGYDLDANGLDSFVVTEGAVVVSAGGVTTTHMEPQPEVKMPARRKGV